MIRKFKTLGLAMVAVLAMSAFVASAAQAQFTASSYPTSVGGYSPLGNDIFTVDGSSVECEGTFGGSMSGASSTLVVGASYQNCKAFGFASATVNMNGCKYVFHDTANNHQNKVTVSCPAGASIVITAGNCEVKVGGQGPLGNVVTTTSGSNVSVRANVSGITANRTKDGFLCPLSGTGHALSTYVQDTAVTVSRSGGGSISVH